MKCLLFIITLCSIGRSTDVQGHNDALSNLAGDELTLEITEDNPPEESEQSTNDDKYNSNGDDDTLEQERHEIKKVKMSGGSNPTDNSRDDQGEHDAITVEITEDNPTEESEQSTYDDSDDSNGDDNPSKAENSEQERHKKNKKLPGGLDPKGNYKEKQKRYQQYLETMKRWVIERDAGEPSDLIGQNQHIEQSNFYNDLGRRSVAQALQNIAQENVDHLTPEKAPPELVLLVAKESALLRAGKETDDSDFDRKKILRSGNYWNGVWKEDVKPKSAVRSGSPKKKLGSIKAKINPGTEFYKVVSRMKKISPQLLYIINKKQL